MVVKRKHEELEEAKVEAVASSSRLMQGQGENKHSIDSDDEEDDRKAEERFDKIKDDDIEGQEDDTVTLDGEIKITPFNLREERQEGEFSKDGDFIWNKKDDVKDAWLDNIDWVKIKQKSKAEKDAEDEADEAEEEAQSAYNELDTYKTMVEMMRPGESVARTLRRLGGNKAPMSASQRWKKKKAGETEDPQAKENKEKMLRLTGLADTILTRSGNMEVYEETFESITHKIKLEEEKKVGPKTSIPDGVDDDDALDMFADNLDEKAKVETTESAGAIVTGLGEDDVRWEFKWKEEDEEIHGPHSSQSMFDWQESGYFADGVLVRKVGTQEFRDSKRMDFELYV